VILYLTCDKKQKEKKKGKRIEIVSLLILTPK
jgi:putative ubiquitin-RnfH superfamily antitoxin RatB of RatAB toxin-antitoxin module